MDFISEEEQRVVKACLKFATMFADYVKEIDPVLWENARQYAIDYTNEGGVKFYDTTG